MIWLIYVIQLVAGQVGTLACTSYGTQPLCDATGYCFWQTTCKNLDCYRVNEVNACRLLSGQTGALNALCDPLEQFSLQYDNVCVDQNDSRLKYCYIRYSMTETGSSTTTTATTPTAVAAMVSTPTAAKLFELYTLNIQKATNAQLSTILDAYIAFGSLLISETNSHPFYIEKAMYQSIQNIRDDITITSGNRQTILTKVWSLGDTLFSRLLTFTAHYQTNYFFIGFSFTSFHRLYLLQQGQLHNILVEWTSYTANGFMQIIQLTPETFGVVDALSDVLLIKPVTTAGANIAHTYKLTWSWQDPSLSVVAVNVKLYTYNKQGNSNPTLITNTITCDMPNKKCASQDIVHTVGLGWQSYYFTYGPRACVGKNKVQCQLSLGTCTYNTGTGVCS